MYKLVVLVVVEALGAQKPPVALVTEHMRCRRAFRTTIAAEAVSSFTGMVLAVIIALVTIGTPVVDTHEAGHASDDVEMTSVQKQVQYFSSRWSCKKVRNI